MFVDPIIPGRNAVVQESPQQQQIASSPAAAASGPEPDGHNESATHSEQIPANQSTAEDEAKTGKKGSAEAMPVDEIGTPNPTPAPQHEFAQIETQTPETATTPPTVSTPTSSTTESVVTKMTLTVRYDL